MCMTLHNGDQDFITVLVFLHRSRGQTIIALLHLIAIGGFFFYQKTYVSSTGKEQRQRPRKTPCAITSHNTPRLHHHPSRIAD